MCIYSNGWLFLIIVIICLKNVKRLIIICMEPFLEIKNSLKWVSCKWVFIFCWRFRHHFFRHTNFLKFCVKFFLKIQIWGCHWKMYRLGPCIPIFRVFFLLKIQKGCVYVSMLFLILVIVKNVFLGFTKCISKLLCRITPKHSALTFKLMYENVRYIFYNFIYFIFNLISFSELGVL